MPAEPYAALHSLKWRSNMKTLQDILSSGEKNTDVLFDDLIDCILRKRRSVCADPEIDYIHRRMILDQPALRNSMYRHLLADTMSEPEHYKFMSDYQSQIKNFYKNTLPMALSKHGHPVWQDYLSHIIQEESEPRPHYILFTEFMDLCGAPLLDPGEQTKAFSRAHNAGYTAPSPFAAGYALAVEAGAEYEIALMKKAYNGRYSQYLDRAIWFDAHLNGTEEEHCEASANLLQAVVCSSEELQLAKDGFNSFFADLSTWLEGYSDLIDRERSVAGGAGLSGHHRPWGADERRTGFAATNH
jgi:hypothetical protein